MQRRRWSSAGRLVSIRSTPSSWDRWRRRWCYRSSPGRGRASRERRRPCRSEASTAAAGLLALLWGRRPVGSRLGDIGGRRRRPSGSRLRPTPRRLRGSGSRRLQASSSAGSLGRRSLQASGSCALQSQKVQKHIRVRSIRHLCFRTLSSWHCHCQTGHHEKKMVEKSSFLGIWSSVGQRCLPSPFVSVPYLSPHTYWRS